MSVLMAANSLRRTHSETSSVHSREMGMSTTPRPVYVTIPEHDLSPQPVVYPSRHTSKTIPWKERLTSVYQDYHLRHIIPMLMLLLYSLLTAIALYLVESPNETRMLIEKASKLVIERDRMVEDLMTVWGKDYLLDNERIRNVSRSIAIRFEETMGLHKEVGRAIPWDMHGALFYTATIYTTIGYGSIAPRTTAGRMLTVVFALPGIALVLAILSDYGKLFFKASTYLYQQSYRRLRRSKKKAQSLSWSEHETSSMPLKLALLICLGWVLICAAIFCVWETNWTYPSAVYFLFVSLTTIGLGDMAVEHTGMLLLFFWLIFIGLALISMLVNVIQQKIEEWLYEMMRQMREEQAAALAMGDCPERAALLERVMNKQPLWVRALAGARDTGGQIERLEETAAVVDEVTAGLPRSPGRESPPPAEPIPSIGTVAKATTHRHSLLSASISDMVSVASTMSRHVASVDDKLCGVRFDRGTSPQHKGHMAQSVQTEYNDEADISTFDVVNYINALGTGDEFDTLLAHCQHFAAALTDVPSSMPREVELDDVVDYVNAVESEEEMHLLRGLCHRFPVDDRREDELVQQAAPSTLPPMSTFDLVPHVNALDVYEVETLLAACPVVQRVVNSPRAVEHALQYINSLGTAEELHALLAQCPQLTAFVADEQTDRAAVKYINGMTTEAEVETMLSQCPQLMVALGEHRRRRALEHGVQTEMTMTDMLWSPDDTPGTIGDIGIIQEETEPADVVDAEVQTDGTMALAQSTSAPPVSPQSTSVADEPATAVDAVTETTPCSTNDHAAQCSFDLPTTRIDRTSDDVECQTDDTTCDDNPIACTVDDCGQTSLDLDEPSVDERTAVPDSMECHRAMTDSVNQTSFDAVSLIDVANQTDDVDGHDDVDARPPVAHSTVQTSFEHVDLPVFELTPVECHSTMCQTEGGVEADDDDEWVDVLVSADVVTVDTQTPWVDLVPEETVETGTQPDRLITLHTAMQTDVDDERQSSVEPVVVVVEFASTSSQTQEHVDEPRARPLMRFNTLARVASSFRGKHKEIAVNTHDGCMQTDYMLNRESTEIQTDDSYLRIARRLNSLRSKKGTGVLSGVIAVSPGRPKTIRKNAANLSMLTEHESRSPSTSAKSSNERYRRHSKRRGSDGVDVVKAMWEKRSEDERGKESTVSNTSSHS